MAASKVTPVYTAIRRLALLPRISEGALHCRHSDRPSNGVDPVISSATFKTVCIWCPLTLEEAHVWCQRQLVSYTEPKEARGIEVDQIRQDVLFGF
jgi:hypothetical protein